LTSLYKNVYIRFAKNFNVYDGDSIRCDLDEGDSRWEIGRALRLYGVDTPELKPLWKPHYETDGERTPETTAARDFEKAAGREARDRVKELIDAATGMILVQTIKLPGRTVRDKYGRTLARIFIPIGEVWVDVAETLIAEGHARPYAGGRKTKWTILRDLEQPNPDPATLPMMTKAA